MSKAVHVSVVREAEFRQTADLARGPIQPDGQMPWLTPNW